MGFECHFFAFFLSYLVSGCLKTIRCVKVCNKLPTLQLVFRLPESFIPLWWGGNPPYNYAVSSLPLNTLRTVK
ncbi:MAG: hypothetical protein IJ881_09915 [Neisseriaceae bacterium]|nr:hypothetical protein [Neisseriaceae bacterium]MBR3426283.1 hypothetical protein [Neisseriaceae bacterium]